MATGIQTGIRTGSSPMLPVGPSRTEVLLARLGLVVFGALSLVLVLAFLWTGQFLAIIQLPTSLCLTAACWGTIRTRRWTHRARRLWIPMAFVSNSLFCLRLDFDQLSLVSKWLMGSVSTLAAYQLVRAMRATDLPVRYIGVAKRSASRSRLIDFFRRLLSPLGLSVEESMPGVVRKPESVEALLGVDVLELQVGRGLLSLVDPNQGAKLLERVTSIRRHIAMELGIVVPGIRFRDNLQLKPNAYNIKIKEVEVATGEVMVNQFLAIGPEDKLRNLRGTRTLDPTYGRPGVWISREQRGETERLGCMIFDPVSVIATQLTDVIRTRAADLLGRQEVHVRLKALRKTHRALVCDLIPQRLTLGELRQVLRSLLKERVRIRDMVSILESLADNVGRTRDIQELTEEVRLELAGNICQDYANADQVIHAITLSQRLTDNLLQQTAEGLRLDIALSQGLLAQLEDAVADFQSRSLQPIVVCAPALRRPVRHLTQNSLINLVVLSTAEIVPSVRVEAIVVLQ